MLALSAATGLGAAGCGVPADDAPRPVDPELLPAEEGPSEAADGASAGTEVARIALVGPDERLVLVNRPAPPDSAGPVAGLLDALSAGPTPGEQGLGLSSALPGGTVLRVGGTEGGVASIDVRGETMDSDPDRLPLAVAQIVVTAGSVPGVDAVLLTREGDAVAAPLPSGELAGGPLTVADYAPLVAAGVEVVPSG